MLMSDRAPIAEPADCFVTVNGEMHRFVAGVSALSVVRDLGFDGRPIAVELNGQVVPRAELDRRVLVHGDRLEVVTLVGGG